MPEKEKNKRNPFAAFLRPTEELLWQSSEGVTNLTGLIPRPSLHTVISIALLGLIIIGILYAGQKTRSSSAELVGAMSTVGALTAFWIRYTFRRRSQGRVLGVSLQDHAVYAVTSERLFYQRGDDIRAEALENITLIHILPNGTLSFGAVFPMWPGLDNAGQVKSIIEQAQKERLKALHT